MDDQVALVEGEQTKQLVAGNPPPIGRHVAAVAIAAMVGFAAGMGGTLLLSHENEANSVLATQARNATTLSVTAAGNERTQGPAEVATIH